MDEQRVVGLGGGFGRSDRSRVREAVAGTDHEGVEGVLRVQSCVFPGGALRRSSRQRLRWFRTAFRAHGRLRGQRFLGGLDRWLFRWRSLPPGGSIPLAFGALLPERRIGACFRSGGRKVGSRRGISGQLLVGAGCAGLDVVCTRALCPSARKFFLWELLFVRGCFGRGGLCGSSVDVGIVGHRARVQKVRRTGVVYGGGVRLCLFRGVVGETSVIFGCWMVERCLLDWWGGAMRVVVGHSRH